MNPTDDDARSPRDSVSLELDLHHAPEKVWRALTEPRLLAEWLLPAIGFEPTPGAAFVFKTDPHPPWDGSVRCRVLTAEPERSLSYAWVVGDMAIDTVVTFTLTPTPAGTRLAVLQTGFRPDQKQASGGARYGWKMMTGRLVDVLAGLA